PWSVRTSSSDSCIPYSLPRVPCIFSVSVIRASRFMSRWNFRNFSIAPFIAASFVFLRVTSWLNRSLLLSDRFLGWALPEHVDDHPFAVEFRQVHIINAPLGHQLHRRCLIQQV